MEKSKLRSDLAVMNALRRLGAGVDQVVEFSQLQRIWPEFGLRCGDLKDSVWRLAAQGHLRAGGLEAGGSVTLTRRGAVWSDANSGLLEYLLLRPRLAQPGWRKTPAEGGAVVMGAQAVERRRRSPFEKRSLAA